VSSAILVISPAIDDQRIKDQPAWVQRVLMLLESMVSAGNLIASWRKSEIQQLDQMINKILELRSKTPIPADIVHASASLQQVLRDPENLPLNQDSMQLQSFNMMHVGTGDDISADQIMAIASSIQEEDVEWMDRAIAENSIW
jgi:proline utilization trans-activator